MGGKQILLSLKKKYIFDFYKNKFDDNMIIRPSFSSNLFKKLSSEDAFSLDSSFSIEEIKEVVWYCGVGILFS